MNPVRILRKLSRNAGWTRRARVANPLWQRARRTPVYDRDGYIGRIQLACWCFAIFFFLCVAIGEPHELGDGEIAMSFLWPTWMAVAIAAAIFGGTGLSGDRRRGFLDQVLVTPLRPSQIVNGSFMAVLEHLRRLYWLPCLLGLVFMLTLASPPLGVFCSIVAGTLFCIFIILHGMACSLAAQTTTGALIPTMMMPLVIIIGPPLLIEPLRNAAPYFLWSLSAILLASGWLWCRCKLHAGAICCYFSGLHLLLACMSTIWVWKGSMRSGHYFLTVNPAAWVIAPLDDRYLPIYWPENLSGTWFDAFVSYVAALAGTIILLIFWLYRHFNQLTGRVDQRIRSHMTAHS